jgi:hypothetical protein
LDLWTQYVIYEQNLRILLQSVVLHNEVEGLLDDPAGDMWKGPVGDRLKDRLGKAYGIYRGTVTLCESILKEIVTGLDVVQDKTRISFAAEFR